MWKAGHQLAVLRQISRSQSMKAQHHMAKMCNDVLSILTQLKTRTGKENSNFFTYWCPISTCYIKDKILDKRHFIQSINDHQAYNACNKYFTTSQLLLSNTACESQTHKTTLKSIIIKYMTTTTTVLWPFIYTGHPALAGTAPKNWRISFVQSFTARMPWLTATTAFRLGRRCCSSPQQCYLHSLCTLYNWK